MKFPNTPAGWFALVASIIALFGVTIGYTHDERGTSVTIHVDSKLTPTGTAGATALTTTQGALEAIEHSASSHTELGATTTAGDFKLAQGVSGADLAAGVKQNTALAKHDQLPEYDVAAASSLRGCHSRFIQRNYSSRNGVRPRLIVLHQTISPDNGWAGVNNITGYFNLQGPSVSSNVVHAGATSACNYIVPMSQKSWAQVGFNSLAISIEVTGTQSQGYYTKGQGTLHLETVIFNIARTWRIPIRRGAIAGCTYTRSGVVDHDQLGSCGGNHNDVNPYRSKLPVLIHGANRCQELAQLRRAAAWRKAHGHKPVWTQARSRRATSLKEIFGAQATYCRY